MSIFCCPVCGGNGLVAAGFYMRALGQPYVSSSTALEPCRSCRGTGIVSDKSELLK